MSVVSTMIVGVVFASIVGIAAYKARKDMKTGKCAGCSDIKCPTRRV